MPAECAASAKGARGAAAKSAAVAPRMPNTDTVFGSIAGPPSGAERRFDKREGALAADIIDRSHAEHRVQLLGRHLHRPGRRRASRCRLRECGGPCGMERDVALDLLLDLVDVAVEHGDRPEALQIAESAGSVLGSPSPFLIDRPQR